MPPEQVVARVATIGARTDCRFLMNQEHASWDPAASDRP
jgi:hypothetical protein